MACPEPPPEAEPPSEAHPEKGSGLNLNNNRSALPSSMALQLGFKPANLPPAPYYLLYVMPYWLLAMRGGGLLRVTGACLKHITPRPISRGKTNLALQFPGRPLD
jgi:hypothetical protein